MNVGLAQHAIGGTAMLPTQFAAVLLELPTDQQNSEWANEYRQVLEKATGQADGQSSKQSGGGQT
jgi:hypothetical protein